MMDPVLLQHYRDNVKPIDKDLVTKTCARMERRLKIRAAGLLVCERSNPGDEAVSGITYPHRTVHDFLYETEQGRTIVALSNQTIQNMIQRRIYAHCALFVQGNLSVSIPGIQYVCNTIVRREREEIGCLCIDLAALDWIDQKLKVLVRSSCNGVMLSSWLSELRARGTAAIPHYQEDFASLLVDALAFELARTFVIGKNPSNSYLGHLLACTLANMDRWLGKIWAYTKEQHEQNWLGGNHFARWLIERDADLFAQHRRLPDASSVSQDERKFRMLLTPLSHLVRMLWYGTASHGHELFMECSSLADTEELLLMALRKVSDDTILQLPVKKGLVFGNHWEPTAVHRQHVFFLMNVHASKFR